MKKAVAVCAFFFLALPIKADLSLRGEAAQQIFNLMPSKEVKAAGPVSMTLKVLNEISCSKKIDEQGKLKYRCFFRTKKAPQSDFIWLSRKSSKIFYQTLMGPTLLQPGESSWGSVINKVIACNMEPSVNGKYDYECSIQISNEHKDSRSPARKDRWQEQ